MSTTIKILLLLLAMLVLLVLFAVRSPLQAINALTPENTYRKSANLAYGPDPRHRLDVFAPLTVKGSAPVVIFFYGGTWNSGNRSDYEFVGEALASRGMVAVLADYRL